jgi:2'-5' RNA ligase
MIRLFIAWPLPHEVEQELGRISFLLKQKGGRVSWVAPKNIHLTARFLGDTDEKLVVDLKRLIDRVASVSRAATLTIDKLGAFPDFKRPRVIWAGLGGDTSPLQATADLIEHGVCEFGFATEPKKFKLHLTLGRVKDSHGVEALMMAVQQFRPSPMAVVLDRLVLFKSTLTPQGSIYERLHERALGVTDTFSG